MNSGSDVGTKLDQSHPNLLGAAEFGGAQAGLPVAQYVRMSTEFQCYSTQNQMHAIAAYAGTHGMVIVRSFSDEGKSGLRTDRRPGLLNLLSVVQSGLADFKAILVYDVSRWGRFQDADESGYWEYICKRAGVRIHYCAEPFVNDDSSYSAILKSIKRTMAAEYSRELSAKTFAGQCRLVELGFSQGGTCCYGMRRMLIDQEHRPKGLLPYGARKSLHTDRIVLVPGPEREQRIVQEIYRSFVEEGKSRIEIANDLNARGIDSGTTRPWSHDRIHRMLTNPKYIGTNVYNRRSAKLKQRAVFNPESLWIHRDCAFAPIISADLFYRAKRLLEIQSYVPSDEEMLNQLRTLFLQKGTLSGRLIDETPGMSKRQTFSARFGGLRRAYEKVGYTRKHGFKKETEIARVRCLSEFLSKLRAVGVIAAIDSRTRIIQINEDLKVWLAASQCSCDGQGFRWWIPRKSSSPIDLTIMARLNAANDAILDFYVFPKEGLPKRQTLRPHNSLLLDVYRFDNLDVVCDIFRRKRVGDDHDAQGTE